MTREVGRKPESSGYQRESVACIFGRPQKEKQVLDLSVRRSPTYEIDKVTLSISVVWLKLEGVKE